MQSLIALYAFSELEVGALGLVVYGSEQVLNHPERVGPESQLEG